MTTIAPAVIIPKVAQINLPNDLGLMSANLMDVIVYYSPIILSFCILILSVFYQSYKGFVFFLFVSFFAVIRKLLAKALFTKSTTSNEKNCSTFTIFQSDKSDGFVTFFVTFVAGYILAPMFIKNIYNIPVMAILLLYLVIVTLYQNKDSCCTFATSLSNILYGVISAALTVIILVSAGLTDKLFTEDLVSDATVCSMPSKQSFKCSVYKNGEIISSTTQSN